MSGLPDGGGPAVDAAGDFGGFDGRAWLNCAHQGPLPLVAVAAAERALADKAAPHRMGDEAFAEVPRRLKDALGRLIGVPAEEVILGNSTTYGLQLLVQGVDWRAGDEVLLVDGDFPATIVPWLPLAERGVRVRLLRPEGGVPDAAQLEAELTPATRLFCTSWVFSFTGHAADLAALGRVCRRAGVTFVVNGSQGVGARPLDLAELPVDALVSCGFKWLCGPYGTGFCWLAPDLLASLTYRPAYWLGHLGQGDLGQEAAYRLHDDLGAAAYDVFGHHRPERTPELYRRLEAAGIDVAFRRGRLRVSPHLYNTGADLDRALEVLDGHTAPVGSG